MFFEPEILVELVGPFAFQAARQGHFVAAVFSAHVDCIFHHLAANALRLVFSIHNHVFNNT